MEIYYFKAENHEKNPFSNPVAGPAVAGSDDGAGSEEEAAEGDDRSRVLVFAGLQDGAAGSGEHGERRAAEKHADGVFTVVRQPKPEGGLHGDIR